MLGKFSWKKKSDGGLDFSWWESLLLVVSNKFWGFSGNFLEDIVDEWVHDWHGSLWDSSFWVNLFQYSVDIYWEWLDSFLFSCDFWLFGFWGIFSWGLWWHFKFFIVFNSNYFFFKRVIFQNSKYLKVSRFWAKLLAEIFRFRIFKVDLILSNFEYF